MRFIHQPGSTPLSGYTIQRGIHRGGFGEVYYARSDGGKEVALKLLQHDQDVELRGVTQCLNLKHPNLVNLFDVRTDAHGEHWVVMEYVNGTSLEDVLAAFPQGLPVDEVADWLKGIVAGVSFLHDRGIVHRDLKPANVYRENGTVKVGDVGLSKQIGSDRRRAHTQSVGTVYYMAPEVARGQYGPEVDIYSLGIMLFEMLTGQVPFAGETTAEVLMKHLTAVPNLQVIPAEFRPVIARALEKDPSKRIRSVAEFQQEFDAALAKPLVSSSAVVDRFGTTGFAGPSGVAAAGNRLMETPSLARRASDQKTATSPRGQASLPLPTRTSAQAASAYAQYPPELKSGELPRNGSANHHVPSPPVEPEIVRRSRPPTVPSQSDSPWLYLIAIAFGLWLFSPGSWRSWTGLILIGAGYAAGTLIRSRWMTGTVLPTPAPRTETLSAPDPRLCDLRSDMGSSLAIGSVCACLLSVGGILSSEFFQRLPKSPSAEFVAMCTAMSLLATWMVLLTGPFLRSGSWFANNPRKTFLGLGILIGSAAFALDQFLLVDFSSDQFIYSPAYRTVGAHHLIEGGMNPTWLGFVVFFGGLMFLHRWSLDVSPRRSKRISLWRIFTAGIAAWLMTIMFAFPQWPAVLWAGVISGAVQLSAAWSPRQSRVAYRRG
jgi:eukaryotic-like serine/threonine-protein kinase